MRFTTLQRVFSERVIKDYKRTIKDKTNEMWSRQWLGHSLQNKLRRLKRDTKPFKSMEFLKRRDSVVLSRLRVGHTRLTHGHLMERCATRICECGRDLTVKHLFECNRFKTARENSGITDLADLVTENRFENVVKFVKEINYYSEI